MTDEYDLDEKLSNIFQYNSIALGFLSYYTPYNNILQIISLIRKGPYHSLCIAICTVTGVPPLKVPTTLSQISEFINSVKLLVKQINKSPPSFKRIKKPTETQDYEVRSSTMLCPCAVSGCSDTDVFVFHVRIMKDYLNAIGSVLIKKGE